MTDEPIACSLGAADMQTRLAEMKSLGDAALVYVEQSPARATLSFSPAAGIRERLAAVVEAESNCCPFLAMSLDAAGDRIGLTIAAPDGAEPVLSELVAAFRGSR